MKSPSSEQHVSDLVPVGMWIQIELRGLPSVIAFTYVDREAGFSAMGWELREGGFDKSTRTIVRQPGSSPWRRLNSEEIRAYDLDPAFPVAEAYGPQPEAGSLWGIWRHHPKLKGRLLPDYPDDLQVLVHDGGRRSALSAPEAIWVRISGLEGDLFRGVILNQPHKLQSIRYASEIQFLVAEGADFPIMVTDKYISERPSWIIHPCDKCGLSEMFDAPSDYFRAAFPDAPAGGHVAFTAFCPLCDGIQGVEEKGIHEKQPASGFPGLVRAKPWWQFWN